MPSDAAAAAAAGASATSSDEDTSDEAFAARHAGLEAEEQQRFNSFAGEPAFALCCQLLGWMCVAVVGIAEFPAASRNSCSLIPYSGSRAFLITGILLPLILGQTQTCGRFLPCPQSNMARYVFTSRLSPNWK